MNIGPLIKAAVILLAPAAPPGITPGKRLITMIHYKGK